MQEYGRRYPHAGYGGAFRHWLRDDNPQPVIGFSTRRTEENEIRICHPQNPRRRYRHLSRRADGDGVGVNVARVYLQFEIISSSLENPGSGIVLNENGMAVVIEPLSLK